MTILLRSTIELLFGLLVFFWLVGVTMEEGIANLNIEDEEEDALHERAPNIKAEFQLCLVGRCLTDNVVNFASLKRTLANLWHLLGGITITNLGNKRYIFKFFH